MEDTKVEEMKVTEEKDGNETCSSCSDRITTISFKRFQVHNSLHCWSINSCKYQVVFKFSEILRV